MDWKSYLSIIMHVGQSLLLQKFNLGYGWLLLTKYPVYVLLSTYYLTPLSQIAWAFIIDAISLLVARCFSRANPIKCSNQVNTQYSVSFLFTIMASVLISVLNYISQKIFLNGLILGNSHNVVTSLVAPPLPLQYLAHVPIGYVIQRVVFSERPIPQSLFLMIFLTLWNCFIPYSILFSMNWSAMFQVVGAYLSQIWIITFICWALSL